MCFLSSHTTTALADTLYIYGGYTQQQAEVDERYPASSSIMYKIDTNTWKLDAEPIDTTVFQGPGFESRWRCMFFTLVLLYATAGASSSFLGESLLIVIGGTNKSINIYTKMAVPPDICDLGDSCNIEQSQTTPIPWILCEHCKKWLHMFCLGLQAAPVNDYVCNKCLPGKKSSSGTKKKVK